jgi:hypothetical protein
MKKNKYAEAIRSSGLTIYDELTADPTLKIPTEELEKLLKESLVGIDLSNLAIRTRSKVVKERVCQAMGYPLPNSFRRTRPRFPGQDLDINVQVSRNLQIWNEDITPSRRYAIIILSSNSTILDAKIITGQELKGLDTTGKLTTKYQAILRAKSQGGLLSKIDSVVVQKSLGSSKQNRGFETSPKAKPMTGCVLSIQELYNRLKQLEGKEFNYSGAIQERARGAVLHKAVCEALGYKIYEDDGRFPDITAQLLEVKLQTSQTIDLGREMPNDMKPIANLKLGERTVRPSDIRYALFDAERTDGYKTLRIKKIYLVTGADFFKYFGLMKGKGQNKKLQFPLPKSMFP